MRNYDGMAWEDYDYNHESNQGEPCEICGSNGYCDPVAHAEFELKMDKIDNNLSSYKCGDCGGIISISQDWGWCEEFQMYEGWAQCCDRDCAVNYAFLYRDSLKILGLWRGYGGMTECYYKAKPIDLNPDEIPF